MSYILDIGLEIHIKIKSENKLFCQCKNEQNFDTLLPNTHICPVCTGQPGALPTISYEPFWQALLLGKVLNCKINTTSTFDRKSYFYPDLPMGYQITQLYNPTNIDGHVTFFIDEDYTKERTVGIRDAHIENDTAKMIHNDSSTLIDFNRAGTPLVEIVTNPDFHDANEVSEFLKELQRRVRYNNISDADMDKGQMRIDVNLSIRKSKDEPLGNRVELKNINSFGMIRRAIHHEYNRQVEILEKGGTISQDTRSWNDQLGESRLMRSKENALDYRYFPEPDIPSITINQNILDKLKQHKTVIPHQIIKKLREDFKFHKEYINTLISNQDNLTYFESILSEINKKNNDTIKNAKTIIKWISGPISAYIKENFIDINQLPFDKDNFIRFIYICLEGQILDNQLKQVMTEMLQTGKNVEDIIKEKGFDQQAINGDELSNILNKILQENETVVQQYKDGKTSTIGFLIGQAMKATQGKANPQTIKSEIEKLLKS